MKIFPLALLALTITASCAPRPATPSPNEMLTAVAEDVLKIVALTASAATPTAPPTATITPLPADTPTPAATLTPEHANPMVINFAGCYFGPGVTFTLESNISKGKRVELLGNGSEPGWYIIRNPYFHRPCWIAAADLNIDPGVDTSALPIMTPGEPLMGH